MKTTHDTMATSAAFARRLERAWLLDVVVGGVIIHVGRAL